MIWRTRLTPTPTKTTFLRSTDFWWSFVSRSDALQGCVQCLRSRAADPVMCLGVWTDEWGVRGKFFGGSQVRRIHTQGLSWQCPHRGRPSSFGPQSSRQPTGVPLGVFSNKKKTNKGRRRTNVTGLFRAPENPRVDEEYHHRWSMWKGVVWSNCVNARVPPGALIRSVVVPPGALPNSSVCFSGKRVAVVAKSLPLEAGEYPFGGMLQMSQSLFQFAGSC